MDSLLATMVWVVRQTSGPLDDDQYLANLHRVIDFRFDGEPIWGQAVVDQCEIRSPLELEKFSQLSIHPVVLI